jgi:cbb3-type cytochrome oxidase subunit 3
MNPDVFITVVFAAFVVVFTSSAVAVIVHMVRRQRRTDANSDASAEVPKATGEAREAAKSQLWTSA